MIKMSKKAFTGGLIVGGILGAGTVIYHIVKRGMPMLCLDIKIGEKEDIEKESDDMVWNKFQTSGQWSNYLFLNLLKSNKKFQKETKKIMHLIMPTGDREKVVRLMCNEGSNFDTEAGVNELLWRVQELLKRD
jgi:hypothetical protein